MKYHHLMSNNGKKLDHLQQKDCEGAQMFIQKCSNCAFVQTDPIID
jgi:hypothetical protein